MLDGCFVAYLVVMALLAVYGGHRVYLTARYWLHRSAPAPSPRLPDLLPRVTVQLPLFNEPAVADRVIAAAAALDWPRDRLEIQILCDSTDETREICRRRTAELRELGYQIAHLHRDDRQGFKAGALAAGLVQARGELILILDADFVPPPDLLRGTAGYFSDPGLGMVQVRWEHLNRDHSVLTRVQALLLDGHFVVEQSVRAESGRFFNFNGTAGLWRRSAIEDAGGWQHDTLTEDLDLSYRALLRGWRFEYLVGLAAPAELPVAVTGFKSQQFRWAKGSVEVAKKLLPRVLAAPVPFRVKLEACFHLTQNLPYLLTLLLCLLTVPVLVVRGSAGLWLDLPLLLFTSGVLLAYCATSQRALGRRITTALLQVPALAAITAGISVSQSRAVIEGAIGIPSEFVRTPKAGAGAGPISRAARLRVRGRRDLTTVAEVALAGYFAIGAAMAAAAGLWTAVPILLVFGAGFGYVGAATLLRR